MEIQVRPADHSVEEEKDRLLEGWWEDELPAEPKPKKGKKAKAKASEPAAEEVSNLDTRTPEQIEAEQETTAQLVKGPLLIIGRVLTVRLRLQEYGEDEAEELARAVVPVLDKYFPALTDFGPEILLALVLLGQVSSRFTMLPAGQEVAIVEQA